MSLPRPPPGPPSPPLPLGLLFRGGDFGANFLGQLGKRRSPRLAAPAGRAGARAGAAVGGWERGGGATPGVLRSPVVAGERGPGAALVCRVGFPGAV